MPLLWACPAGSVTAPLHQMLLGQVDADDVQTRRVDAQQRAALALAGGVDVETALADQLRRACCWRLPISPRARVRSAARGRRGIVARSGTAARTPGNGCCGARRRDLPSSSCRACAGGTRWCWRTKSLVQSFLVRAPMIRIMRAAVWSCSNPQSLYYSNRKGDSGTIKRRRMAVCHLCNYN